MDDWTAEEFEDEFWNIADGSFLIGEEPLMTLRAERGAEKDFAEFVSALARQA